MPASQSDADQSMAKAAWVPVPRRPAELGLVASELNNHEDWLIVTHERPDGDATGSALAMACILSAIGKTWTFGVAEPLPTRFDFLPYFAEATILGAAVDSALGSATGIDSTADSAAAIDSATHAAPANTLNQTHKYHAVVAVDCADAARFRYAAPFISEDAVIVNVDHHQTNPSYGTVNLVDPDAAAACELVYHVARQLGLEIEEGLAKCLYTGILTDTGGFAQPNTSRVVHQIAADLLESGVQPYDIAEPALEARTWHQTELLKQALANLTLYENGRAAALYVTRAMLDATGCTDDDTEILVGFARAIDSVEVGMMFRELRDGRVKVSLRSKRRVDVARIAQVFGGGGHTRAAGCEIGNSLTEAMRLVLEAVRKAFVEA